MMKNEQIWTIIGVALVAVVISSITSIYITGDVIKVEPDKTGKAVYTQKEVDSLLNNQKISILNEVDGKIKNISFYDLTVENDLRVRNSMSATKRFGSWLMHATIFPGAFFAHSDDINGGLYGNIADATVQGYGLSVGNSYLDKGKQVFWSASQYSGEGIYLSQDKKYYFCGIDKNGTWSCNILFYEASSTSDKGNMNSCHVDSSNQLVCGKDNTPLADMAKIGK